MGLDFTDEEVQRTDKLLNSINNELRSSGKVVTNVEASNIKNLLEKSERSGDDAEEFYMSKNIVICYDGTNNEYGLHNTNVVKTFEALVRDNNQIAFYDPGVGTLSILGRYLGRKLGILLGLAFGYGIKRNVEDGYEYLMNRYQQGDKIFIFGFSRGAYTARALAGMLHQFGILQKGSKNLIPYVSKMYFKKENKKNHLIISNFKNTFSKDCVPYLIGLWDTVGALGPNLSRKFPDLILNPDIKYGFHAISIDENRRPYKLVMWDESAKSAGQVIEQVWFAGVHSEVGGGCSKNKCSLQDISFAWMMDEAAQNGLVLKEDWKTDLHQDVNVDIHHNWKWAWIFRLLKKRTIPKYSLIHQSVLDKMKNDQGYSPELPDKSKYTVVETESYSKIKYPVNTD